MRAVRQRRRRKIISAWGRHWTLIYGVRSGEWWIGVRRNYPMDMIEWNLLGLTLMVGRS